MTEKHVNFLFLNLVQFEIYEEKFYTYIKTMKEKNYVSMELEKR